MMKNNLLFFAILLVGLGLRFVALDQSLWLDEAIEWWGLTSFDLRTLLGGYMVGDFNPPGHHLLMWFWVRVFGDSEIALRMPSVLFGMGTVATVYAIAKETSGKRKVGSVKEESSPHGFYALRPSTMSPSMVSSGRSNRSGPNGFTLYAPMLAATNGLLIYYSQEARMYAMATFFVTASVWAFLRLQRKYSFSLLSTFYLLLTTALYSHYLAWLMIPVFVIAVAKKREIARGTRYAAPLLATIPLWPLLIKQLQAGISSAGNSQWAMLSQTTPKNIALVFVKFVTGRVPFPERWELQVLVAGLVALFWLGVARGVREMWREREQRIIAYWLVMPLVLGGLIGLFIPVFSYFRFLFVLPAAILLFVRGVLMREMRVMWVMRGMGVVVLLSFSLSYLLFPLNHRENWRDLVKELRRNDATPVVAIFSAVRPPFDYYDRSRSTIMAAELLQLREQFSADPELTRIWVIPYGKDIFDPDDTIRKLFVSFAYRRTFERHFRGATLEQWQKFRLPDRPKFFKF